MHALRFDHFGNPGVLQVAELGDPVAASGEAVIAVKSSSVNPSDLKNVAGSFRQTTLPRIPGRDFAGVVVDGPRDWIGAEVWGTGGDIGFTRDGPHAEKLTIPAAALARKPEPLSFEEASAVGVNFLVAWLGVVEAAELADGETIAIFGVSGGVGGAVAQIAHAIGARVIGVDRSEPADGTPAASIIEGFVASDGSPQDIGAQITRLSGGRGGADVVFDAVGGVTTPAALASLASKGRLVVISATGTQTVDIDLVDLYRNETRIYGCNSANYDVIEADARLRQLTPYFDAGQFRPLPVSHRYSLEDGMEAYRAVENHVRGRVVICP
jgi:NADPH:quinone reductase